jgi:hypothetical protein
VTSARLRAAVKAVGHSSKNVGAYLAPKKAVKKKKTITNKNTVKTKKAVKKKTVKRAKKSAKKRAK